METLAYFQKGLMLVVALSAPALIVATVVGVLVSLVQALTQVQDQTLSFSIKLVAVGISLAATGRWIGVELLRLASRLLEMIPDIGR
ncbi:type III secretion system export apparatus subunit SctS [Chitinimonas koreensis]|uniref:type III secretion system export apparatus subunit SctS n=1 Tax=Chitinimonas koreensis TaxID=356302 RepID=UPI00040D263B|nr:type III secretion system export apparatus subunit SctS [Chitinimonas koreensis]QNM97646.1 type III secretion system export apparatus subunit SctS [Chitinimonas koreensis]